MYNHKGELLIPRIHQPRRHRAQCRRRFSRERHPRESADEIAREEHREDLVLPYQTRQYMARCCLQADCQYRSGIRVSDEDQRWPAVVLWKYIGGDHQIQLGIDP